jgi:putative hydroxymethylpyrimidine transport system substrate-binding protein
MKQICCWLLGAALASLSVACGGGGGAADEASCPEAVKENRAPNRMEQRLQIAPAGHENAENAALLMAESRGYFSDLGFKPYIYTPPYPSRPLVYVLDETDDFVVSYLPQVILAKEKGAPILAVGSVLSQSTAAMIWLKRSKIRDLADLEGKTIGVPGHPFQERFLEALLAQAGLTLDDVEVKPVKFETVSSLASGRVDAIFGASWNIEGLELKSRGLKPVVARLGEFGIPQYEELVIAVRGDRAEKDPQLIRDIMTAVTRGAAAAIADPDAVVRAIEMGEVDLGLTREEVEAEVGATLPLVSETGYMNPARVSRLVDWMRENRLIQRDVPTATLLTNCYLPRTATP